LAISIPGTLIPDGDFFTTDFDVPENAGAQIFRSGRVARTGNISELALGFGGNYKEKVLWGFTLGIPSINFTETKVYNEVDDQGEVTFYDDAGFDETLEMTGSGVNFKFGLIGRPTDQLRISAAVHSPTLWTIDETFFTDFEYNYTDAGQALGGTAESDLFVESINLATPWRFFLGGGYLIGNNGFISVDADYSNFAGNQFSSDDFAQVNDAANEDIDLALTSSIGVRLGGELNLKPFQVRAGVGYRTQPYVDQRNGEDTALLNYSAGAGYSIGKFFIDVAARLEGNNTYYAPYRTFNFDGQVVDTERTRITGMLTVGFRGF
jgi:long-subunit fatty acid transport protein